MAKGKENKKISVLVTAVGGRSVGCQIFESLKFYKDKYYIIATDANAFSPGLYEADESFILPSAKSADYIPNLLSLAKKRKVKVILPGSLPETEAISANEKLFLQEEIFPIVNPYEVVKMCFNKLDLYKFLSQKGILIPTTIKLKSIEQARKLKFPIVVKPYRDSSGSKNVLIIKDIDELSSIFEKLEREKIGLLAQEYVGDEKEEYTVGTVISKDGRIIDSVVMRRELVGFTRGEERTIDGKDYVLSTGYSQGFIVDQPDVKKYCEKIAKIIGARGPLNIQCRRTKKGVCIFEVHPRFSGSASMRAEVGFNEPHYLIRDFLGLEQVKKIPHKTGYAIIRKFANTVVKIGNFERMKHVS